VCGGGSFECCGVDDFLGCLLDVGEVVGDVVGFVLWLFLECYYFVYVLVVEVGVDWL